MSKKRKISDLALMVLSALFMAAKIVSERHKMTESAGDTE